jgi:hypothetical protein
MVDLTEISHSLYIHKTLNEILTERAREKYPLLEYYKKQGSYFGLNGVNIYNYVFAETQL